LTDLIELPLTEWIASIEIERIETDQNESGFTVGRNGVTRIEAFEKSGMHANIPYVRVWIGESAVAEFCQHQIVGVYFRQSNLATDAKI
jgi:hypothetical protein